MSVESSTVTEANNKLSAGSVDQTVGLAAY